MKPFDVLCLSGCCPVAVRGAPCPVFVLMMMQLRPASEEQNKHFERSGVVTSSVVALWHVV